MKQLLLFLAVFPFLLSAQTDSIALVFKTLDVKDLSDDIFSEDFKLISASRSQKVVGELPLTTYIITKEEIHENGYITLVDALKTVPGIRVSQPGSAIEGETFMMRGLIGNQNTKILINDVPIKPAFLLGMPIGAQLPIRQAERIEIIFGPAAALYGTDASAGVINIILRESERPVFVSADLSFGIEGYKGINLLLGGKIGRNKNIIKFTGFGSYTEFDDRRIFHDTTIYDPFLYVEPEEFIGLLSRDNNPQSNYENQENSRMPVIREFPHLSQLFGFNLEWRKFKFFYENMYRRDHTALGANPTAISISNPQNFTAETFNRFYLTYKKEGTKKTWQTLANALYSNSDKFSSTDFNLNLLAITFLEEIEMQEQQGALLLADSIWRSKEAAFLSGTRFQKNSSLGFRLEQLMSYRPNEKWEMTFGVNGFADIAQYSDFSPEPIKGFLDVTGAFASRSEQFGVGLFGQTYYVSDKINIIAGLQGIYDFSFDRLQLAPRVSTLFKAKKDLNIRAFYGRGFRVPSPYYDFNTNFFSRDSFTLLPPNMDLNSEQTNAFELALNLKNRKYKTNAELLVFHTRTDNLIAFDRIRKEIDRKPAFGAGFFNFNETFIRLTGIQFNVTSRKLIPSIDLNTKLFVQYAIGRELLPQGGEIDAVRAQPAWTFQLKTDLKLGRSIRLNLFHLYHSPSVSRKVNNLAIYEQNLEKFTIPKYYTLDVILLSKLTENFQTYLKVNNVFNAEYFGIDASGTPEDLIRNPQSRRWLSVGISYQL